MARVMQDYGTASHIGWPATIGVALAAGVAAMLLQQAIRALWQVRTLPERMLEYALLFVPPDLFEQGLRQFGTNAKEMALVAAVGGMALILVALAALALRRGWSGWRLILLGVGLWLVTMTGVMPLTGGGLFGTRLPQAALLVNAAYAVVALGYVTVLAAGQALLALSGRAEPAAAAPAALLASPARRAFIVGLGGTLAAFAIARWAGAGGAAAKSDLPLVKPPPRSPASAGSRQPADSTPRPAATVASR